MLIAPGGLFCSLRRNNCHHGTEIRGNPDVLRESAHQPAPLSAIYRQKHFLYAKFFQPSN
jgi:hypothetical protein